MSKKTQWLLIFGLVFIFILCGLVGKILYNITYKDKIEDDKKYVELGKEYYEKLYTFLNNNSNSSAKFCNVDISDSFCQLEGQINTNYQECLASNSIVYSKSMLFKDNKELVSSVSDLFIDSIVDSFMMDKGVNFIYKDNKLYCLSSNSKGNYITYTADYDIISVNREGSSIEYLISASYYESDNILNIKYRNVHFSLQEYGNNYKISYYGLS